MARLPGIRRIASIGSDRPVGLAVRHDGVMTQPDLAVAASLLPRFDASPTPYHAVETVIAQLETAGFIDVSKASALVPGRQFWHDGGALIAWATSPDHHAASGYRIVGAHTDSPNLRIKPSPDNQTAGWKQLGVEVYGGALLNSWLDRDLGLAGRVAVRTPDGLTVRLFRDDRPILRLPQLAIHLDAEISDKGLKLNRQRHMVPVWGGIASAADFRSYLATRLDASVDDIVSWDAMPFDLTPAAIVGLNEEFIATARVDNQLSCFLAVDALMAAAEAPGSRIPMIGLFDHEEVGSVSATGAAAPLLSSTIARIQAQLGASPEDAARSRRASLVISADGAHATHPNYADRHEPEHQIFLNAGPVLKINANQRYATSAVSAAEFQIACESAGSPMQRFISRTDLRCGSTIGPATAALLGIPAVDAGCAQLAMHSAREMCGALDPAYFGAVLREAMIG